MTVRARLVSLILFVGLLPLGLFASVTLQTHQEALEAAAEDLHRNTATSGAATARAELDTAMRSLRLLAGETIRWDELTPDERDGALWVAYRHLDDLAVVALLDGAGAGVGPSVYRGDDAAPELASHPPATLEALQAFAHAIPHADARDRGVGVGRAFVAGDGLDAILPVAVGSGAPDRRWIVAAALSLRRICGGLAKLAGNGLETSVVDPDGRVLCGAQAGRVLDVPLANRGGQMLRYAAADGRAMLAAIAPIEEGLAVVTRQPADAAFATGRRLRLLSLLILLASVAGSLVAGLALAQRITGPVQRLVDGTREFAAGRLGHRIAVRGRDELAQLSRAFNEMGAGIEQRDAQIRAWNAELQARVEQRTKELEETQEQLLQSKKIAAVASLGAGIAHEINNPLASVLGLTQLLLARSSTAAGLERERGLLGSLEKEALRIRGIVRTVLTFSESFAGENFAVLDVRAVAEEVLRANDRRLADARIEVVRAFDDDVPGVAGHRAQLHEALVQLVDNAVKAMPRGGTLTLGVADAGGLVRLTVEDTGVGISAEHLDKVFDPFFTTKQDWRGRGLGLTLAFRIVEQHHGRLKAASIEGHGTTMTITLPAARAAPHLR